MPRTSHPFPLAATAALLAAASIEAGTDKTLAPQPFIGRPPITPFPTEPAPPLPTKRPAPWPTPEPEPVAALPATIGGSPAEEPCPFCPDGVTATSPEEARLCDEAVGYAAQVEADSDYCKTRISLYTPVCCPAAIPCVGKSGKGKAGKGGGYAHSFEFVDCYQSKSSKAFHGKGKAGKTSTGGKNGKGKGTYNGGKGSVADGGHDSGWGTMGPTKGGKAGKSEFAGIDGDSLGAGVGAGEAGAGISLGPLGGTENGGNVSWSSHDGSGPLKPDDVDEGSSNGVSISNNADVGASGNSDLIVLPAAEEELGADFETPGVGSGGLDEEPIAGRPDPDVAGVGAPGNVALLERDDVVDADSDAETPSTKQVVIGDPADQSSRSVAASGVATGLLAGAAAAAVALAALLATLLVQRRRRNRRRLDDSVDSALTEDVEANEVAADAEMF
ncbi:hypothetical protein ACHAWF_002860 [Thalassiosira exigua]